MKLMASLHKFSPTHTYYYHVQTWFVTKAKKEIRYVNSTNVAKKFNGSMTYLVTRAIKEFWGFDAPFFLESLGYL